MTTKIYVANLAKYNEGQLVGKWLTLPMDEDELQEAVQGILGNDEECAIHDYEAVFEISEYDNITRINEIAQILDDLGEDEEVIRAILGNWTDIDYGLGILQEREYQVYSGCSSMADVAQEILDEQGTLDKLPEELRSYFDYAAYGRDLELNGTFLEADHDSYVEVYNH